MRLHTLPPAVRLWSRLYKRYDYFMERFYDTRMDFYDDLDKAIEGRRWYGKCLRAVLFTLAAAWFLLLAGWSVNNAWENHKLAEAAYEECAAGGRCESDDPAHSGPPVR